MTTPRVATPADAADLGRLLHDFNTEYEDFTPGPQAMAERCAELLAAGEITALLVGDGPDGLAVLRFKPSLWASADEAYLEELYVVPDRRGNGLGRTLLSAVLELSRERGATYISLGTSTDDTAAVALYESVGFTNREGKPDGPSMLWYELEL